MSADGRIILVGAGPGDPELLTLKAMRMLREADVVLHDDLVAPEILALLRPETRRISVGKRGGCRSTPQAFIEELMVREAHAGHTVVRLKGGDPFVFGRGGEEVAALEAAGIVVEVVAGITSGLAAPAAIGIPVTHRALAHGVALVTGHSADDGSTEPDWQALVNSRLTLVIYMGMATADAMRANLLAAGMDRAMPVAVIANATRANQASIVATLDNFVQVANAARIRSPAIIVVGRAVSLASDAVTRIAQDGLASAG